MTTNWLILKIKTNKQTYCAGQTKIFVLCILSNVCQFTTAGYKKKGKRKKKSYPFLKNVFK